MRHRQSAQGQGHVHPPPHLAVEAVAQQLFGPLEAIGDGPVGEVEPARCLAAVTPGIDVDLQRLDQCGRFHPRCSVAFDHGRTEEPPLLDVGGGQSAACWLAKAGGRSEWPAAEPI